MKSESAKRSKAMKKYWDQIRKLREEGLTLKQAQKKYREEKNKKVKRKSKIPFSIVKEESQLICPWCGDDFELGSEVFDCFCSVRIHLECIHEFKKCAICHKTIRQIKKTPPKNIKVKKSFKITIPPPIKIEEPKIEWSRPTPVKINEFRAMNLPEKVLALFILILIISGSALYALFQIGYLS